VRFVEKGPLSERKGYFRFGNNVCYGRHSGGQVIDTVAHDLYNALLDTTTDHGTTYLPFDPSEVLSNLQCELYTGDWRDGFVKSALIRMYYLLRPFLSFSMRSYVKGLHLHGWADLPFPSWPVDCSVDGVVEQLLLLSVRASDSGRVPFIWFWPEGATSCAIMTHDVETEAGREFCPDLMDIDDSFGIKSSFQIVPEGCYQVSAAFLASLRERGFEVGIHDLNHDGHLYRTRKQFLRRAARINSYGEQYGAQGFRAGVLYRKQLWFDALDFSYDMSIPNVAHLDPQQGGCCTVMPFFIGKIVELPVTTTQDYMLFHMLNDYSIDLWKQQIELIMEKAGLISFIAHPDYIRKPRELAIYKELLAHLEDLKKKKNLLITTAGEVNRWWRQRAAMSLVEDDERLRIEGVGSERARVAYASERDGRLLFTLEPADTGGAHVAPSEPVRHPGTSPGFLPSQPYQTAHPLPTGMAAQ
jgi:hypothetical protein